MPYHISPDEAHVWIVEITADHSTAGSFLPTLSDQERKRAERFHLKSDRARFVQVRDIVRKILAAYTGADPHALNFRSNQFGKPSLIETSNTPNIHFNVSHSGSCCLFAVRLGRHVGVDVEQVRELDSFESISHRFFTPSEADALSTLEGAARRDAFFSLWTHKEAMVKGLGIGLAENLNQIEFEFDTTSGVRLASWRNDPSITEKWSLRTLSPAQGYIGALACERPMRSLSIKKWQHEVGVL
jgi:4'-phosphopantetheinyl transferase